MQEFIYKLLENGEYCVTGYWGDDAEVIIPDTYCGGAVTVLFDNLFRGHTEITSVRIPDKVTDMGEFVFDGCVNLRHLTLPAELESLWGYTFARCGIEEISLPDKLRSLPPFAFKDCKRLRKVVCGAGLKRISAWVFGGCDSFEELICTHDIEISPQAFKSKEPTR